MVEHGGLAGTVAGQAPRISVVMPSYNQAAFIEEAVCSVLRQPVASLELVVMDGGSSDGTQARLQALAERFGPALRWVSEPDRGPAHAINKAVALARGEWLGWLNSDDLYTEGALQRALDHFAAHPDHVMVYGEAEHVDVAGAFMERYPSLPPAVGIERFRDGCYICQPSIFIRRDAWLAQGGLDERYRASFDFEMWLRMFRAYPGRIGFIEAVQARSRLHAGGITLRFRETVAREGIRLLAEAFGHAPAHWLLTCFEETLAAHPFAQPALDPRLHFAELAHELLPRIEPAQREHVLGFLRHDVRLPLQRPGIGVQVSADGWAGRVLVVDCLPAAAAVGEIRLDCRHASPLGGVLRLDVSCDGQALGTVRVPGSGPFTLALPVAAAAERIRFGIECDPVFVPARSEPGSTDLRELGFRVEGLHTRG